MANDKDLRPLLDQAHAIQEARQVTQRQYQQYLITLGDPTFQGVKLPNPGGTAAPGAGVVAPDTSTSTPDNPYSKNTPAYPSNADADNAPAGAPPPGSPPGAGPAGMPPTVGPVRDPVQSFQGPARLPPTLIPMAPSPAGGPPTPSAGAAPQGMFSSIGNPLGAQPTQLIPTGT